MDVSFGLLDSTQSDLRYAPHQPCASEMHRVPTARIVRMYIRPSRHMTLPGQEFSPPFLLTGSMFLSQTKLTYGYWQCMCLICGYNHPTGRHHASTWLTCENPCQAKDLYKDTSINCPSSLNPGTKNEEYGASEPRRSNYYLWNPGRPMCVFAHNTTKRQDAFYLLQMLFVR